MTDEVINQIVQQVLAAMQTRGLAADTPPQATVEAPPAPPALPAPVQVPLALPVAQPKVQATKAETTSTTSSTRKVFITAEMLERRLATDDGPTRTVELAYNEFLTPAAMDLADQRHLTIRKQPRQLACPAEATNLPTATEKSVPAARGASKGRTLGLVISKPNAMVRGVLDGLERDGIIALDFNRTNYWIENTQMLCQAIVSCSVNGGVVMVPEAADVVMLANKIRGIRAVQGVRPEGLTAAMGRLAPNVLAMEHSSSTFHEIRTMLRTFAVGSASTGRADAVMDAIEKLERA